MIHFGFPRNWPWRSASTGGVPFVAAEAAPAAAQAQTAARDEHKRIEIRESALGVIGAPVPRMRAYTLPQTAPGVIAKDTKLACDSACTESYAWASTLQGAFAEGLGFLGYTSRSRRSRRRTSARTSAATSPAATRSASTRSACIACFATLPNSHAPRLRLTAFRSLTHSTRRAANTSRLAPRSRARNSSSAVRGATPYSSPRTSRTASSSGTPRRFAASRTRRAARFPRRTTAPT